MFWNKWETHWEVRGNLSKVKESEVFSSQRVVIGTAVLIGKCPPYSWSGDNHGQTYRCAGSADKQGPSRAYRPFILFVGQVGTGTPSYCHIDLDTAGRNSS